MRKFCTVIVIIVLFISCGSHEGNGNGAKKDSTHNPAVNAAIAGSGGHYFKQAGDSLEIPAFEIELNLSVQANDKLNRDKETVIVDAWFSGDPKDTTSKEYAESGEMFINTKRIELAGVRIAKFEGIKFSKRQFDLLADKDIRVLINVFSGRKSSSDNLLDCAMLSDKMSAVKGKKFVLAGKLIGEPDSLRSLPQVH